MGDEENRKATLPGDPMFAEIIRMSVKLDQIQSENVEIRRDSANDRLAFTQRMNKFESRLELVETGHSRTTEAVRKTSESFSDLSSHVRSTEMATKAAVDNLGAGMGARMNNAETQIAILTKETKAQTPMIAKVIEVLDEQNRKEEKKRDELHEARLASMKSKRTLAKWAAVGAVLAIVAPTISVYLATKQGNKDAPPQTIVVHEDGGTTH